METTNFLLQRLPARAATALLRGASRIELSRGEAIVETDQEIAHVWFPESCVISTVSVFEDGSTAEMAASGREGFLPVSIAFGSPSAIARCLAQVPGTALRIGKDRFDAALESSPEFAKLVSAFTQAFLAQILQSVACNAVHSAEERCARWLLTTQDRTGTNTFRLSQDYLAELVGVTRPTISVVARTLQSAGLIRYSRAAMTVLDREGLEEASCECYGIIRRAYERRLGFPPT